MSDISQHTTQRATSIHVFSSPAARHQSTFNDANLRSVCRTSARALMGLSRLRAHWTHTQGTRTPLGQGNPRILSLSIVGSIIQAIKERMPHVCLCMLFGVQLGIGAPFTPSAARSTHTNQHTKGNLHSTTQHVQLYMYARSQYIIHMMYYKCEA